MTYDEIYNQHWVKQSDSQIQNNIAEEKKLISQFREGKISAFDLSNKNINTGLGMFLSRYSDAKYDKYIDKVHEEGKMLSVYGKRAYEGYGFEDVMNTYDANEEVAEAKQEVLDYLEGGGGAVETKGGDVQAGSSGSITKKRQNKGGLFGRYTKQDDKRQTLLG